MLPNIPPSPFVVTPAVAAAMARADCDRMIISIQHDRLTNELFEHLWARADPYPLVVTPIPGRKLLQYAWSPEFFTDIAGTTECKAQDCETGEIVPTTVGAFYGLFGKECDTRPVLRLKVSFYFTISSCAFGLNSFLQDYPSSELFQSTIPFSYLHPDLMSATAVPDYTRQDGCFNVASYFPRGGAKSDLGKCFMPA
jgi:lysine-specific demethylase 3